MRTQQIIAEESGVANTIDPLAGSFFVEHETNRLERQVYDYWRQVEALGGVLPAIEQGFFQLEIANAAYRYQREIEAGERIIVGVNGYQNSNGTRRFSLFKPDSAGYERQAARLNELRRERDRARVAEALNALRQAAAGTENTMPYILDAVRAYATLSEVTQTLSQVFGTYQEPNWI
ncbi:MAG: methylmalonyl-CoA mutase family protein [Anaerolineae bacterium]